MMNFRIGLSLWLCLMSGSVAHSQSLLFDDATWEYPRERRLRPLVTRSGGLDTLTLSVNEPFFDDFSQPGLMPTHTLWYTDSSLDDIPLKTFQMAVDPPSLGVITFDGQRRTGIPYATSAVVAGVADRLLSHHLDLSALSPADDVFLSFYLQPQGRGNAPEDIDSFFVYFRTDQSGVDEYEKVYAVGGEGNRPFELITIPVDENRYFHEGFQLCFEAIGGLNGILDHWHLDYVLLAPGRTTGENTFVDASLTQFLSSPLDPYTAVPAQHHDPAVSGMMDFSLNASNLQGSSITTQVRATISDPVGGTTFGGTVLREATPTLPPYAQGGQAFSMGAFSDQSLNGQIVAYEVEATLVGNGDNVPRNDTLIKRFGVDSLLAYDDGEADALFGLNVARGFGIQVNLDRPDSLTGVWISFVPSVYLNPITGFTTYLEDQPFRVVIWSEPNPDSIITQQAGGMRVRYGDEPNHFERYPFPSPVAVPATFWVGVQQVNSLPLGIGLDRTFDRDDLTYFDDNGVWRNVSLEGALMIRPEFFRTAPVPVALESHGPPMQELFPDVFPQPASAGAQVQVRWSASAQPIRAYRVGLRDMKGRQVWQYLSGMSSGDISVGLPAQLPPGYYIWEHQWIDGRGNEQQYRQPFVVN